MKKLPLLIILIVFIISMVFLGLSTNSMAFTTNILASNNKPLYMDDSFLEFFETLEYYNQGYNFVVSNSYSDNHTWYQFCFYSSQYTRLYCTLNQQPYINVNLVSTNNNKISAHYGWIHYENGSYTVSSISHSEVSNWSCQGWVDSNYNHVFLNAIMYNGSSGNNIFVEYNPFVSNINLTGISITALPSKIQYYKGDSLDLTGLVVVASYDNDTYEEIVDYTVSPTVLNNLGNQTITISYYDFTTTFTVTVYENQSSSILGKIYEFFASFFDRLYHLVIPTDEQFTAIQDDFTDNILSKFNISSWSFNSNSLDYPVADVVPIRPPVLHFTLYDNTFDFDTQVIVDFLNTPVSYGSSYTDIGVDGTVPTGGLTPYRLISILLSIDIFIVNILLFNKFFSKGD